MQADGDLLCWLSQPSRRRPEGDPAVTLAASKVPYGWRAPRVLPCNCVWVLLCLCAYVFPAASVRVRWRGPVRIAGWQRTRASMLGRGRLAKSCRRCVKGYFWSSALARALFVCPFCVASGGHGHGNAGGLLRLWRANRRGSRDCSTPSELCTARNAQHCRSETDRTSCRAWSDDIKLDECARAASPRAGI